MCRRVIRSSRGLIPYWCQDPKGGRESINIERETVHNLPTHPIVAPQHVEARASERMH